MSLNFESLGIEKLTVGERLTLIEKIWDTLPERMGTEDVPEWHLAELAARRSDAENRPGVGNPWREVLESLDSGI